VLAADGKACDKARTVLPNQYIYVITGNSSELENTLSHHSWSCNWANAIKGSCGRKVSSEKLETFLLLTRGSKECGGNTEGKG